MYIYIYIYVYTERERERKREMCVYTYIYIYDMGELICPCYVLYVVLLSGVSCLFTCGLLLVYCLCYYVHVSCVWWDAG